MATADEYAAWIVANAGKKGSPEFAAVASAYEEAKAAESAGQGDTPDMEFQVTADRYGGTVTEPDQQIPEPPAPPETTAAGLAGAATRGLSLPAAGALAGGAAGAMLGGVGAVPGAMAGAAAGSLAGMVGDPIVGAINSHFGTKYSMPTEAMEDLLTRLGVPEPRTAAERIVQVTSAGAGGAGGMVAAGRGMQAATSPLWQNIGAKTAELPAAQIAGGAGGGFGLGVAQEAGMDTAGTLGASTVGAIAGSMLPGKPRVSAAVTGAPKAAAGMVTKPAQFLARVAAGKPPAKLVEMAETIRNDPYNADAAGYKLPNPYAQAAQADDLAAEVLRQGWRPKFVAAVKASSPEDYAAMRKMVNLYELGQKRANIAARPADIVGDTMLKRIEYVGNVKRQAGGEIDAAAKRSVADGGLMGAQVDYSPAMDAFMRNLEGLGVKIGQGVPDPDFTVGGIGVSLRGSDIEGDAASKVLLEKVIRRLSTDAPDGYGLHRAKRWIDNQVEYGKKSETGLLGDTERVVKALRRDINQALRDYSPAYERANVKFKDALDSLEALQDAVGTKIDMNGPNADKALGQEARKLLTNYQARVRMLGALDDIEGVARKYGMKVNDSVTNQILVSNELDRMFGAAAEGSLKGVMESALRPGLQVAQGNARQAAFELATGLIDKARGINEANAIAALKRLLNEKQTVESSAKKTTLPAIRK